MESEYRTCKVVPYRTEDKFCYPPVSMQPLDWIVLTGLGTILLAALLMYIGEDK